MNYGDLISEKEFKKYIKDHPNIEIITTTSESKAKVIYEENTLLYGNVISMEKWSIKEVIIWSSYMEKSTSTRAVTGTKKRVECVLMTNR